MILLTTHEARAVHAVLEFGPGTTALLSDADKQHLERAKTKLREHTDGLIKAIATSLGTNSKEPA